MIFLFGLEPLFARDSRAQSYADLSLPWKVGCYWLSWWLNKLLLAPTKIKPVYYSLLSTVWALEKHCLFKMSSSTFACTVFLYNVFVSSLGAHSSLRISQFLYRQLYLCSSRPSPVIPVPICRVQINLTWSMVEDLFTVKLFATMMTSIPRINTWFKSGHMVYF